MTTPPSTQLLDVPGGRMYYGVRGSGPLLLVLGVPVTSEPFEPSADRPARDRTVVTCDPPGMGRRTVEDPERPVTPEIEMEDPAAFADEIRGALSNDFASSSAPS